MRERFDPFRRPLSAHRMECLRRLRAGEVGVAAERLSRALHQIWIGPIPMPDPYRKLTDANREVCAHHNIQHNIWTNEDFEEAKRSDGELGSMIASVPDHDWACKKDIFLLWILKQRGGVVADCSMLATPDFGMIYDGIAHLFLYNEAPALDGLPFAVPCCMSIVGAPQGSALIQEIQERLSRFWHEDFRRLNRLYTDPERFGDTSVPHGWMGQQYVNECLLRRLGSSSPNISPAEIFLTVAEFLTDVDGVPLAHVVKRFYAGSMTQQLFDSLANWAPSRQTA